MRNKSAGLQGLFLLISFGQSALWPSSSSPPRRRHVHQARTMLTWVLRGSLKIWLVQPLIFVAIAHTTTLSFLKWATNALQRCLCTTARKPVRSTASCKGFQDSSLQKCVKDLQGNIINRVNRGLDWNLQTNCGCCQRHRKQLPETLQSYRPLLLLINCCCNVLHLPHNMAESEGKGQWDRSSKQHCGWASEIQITSW